MKTNRFTLVSFVGILAAFAIVAFTFGSRSIKPDPEADYKAIVNVDLNVDYPETPNDVIKFHNQIDYYLFNAPIDDDKKIRNVIDKKRQLYMSQWQSDNSIDALVDQYEYVSSQIFSTSSRMVGVPEDELVVFGIEPKYAFVKVTQVWTANKQIVYDFNLEKDRDGKWKIRNQQLFDSSEGTEGQENANTQ